MQPMLLFLTCANEQEAQAITESLLDAHVVACVKSFKATAHFWYQGNKQSADELCLMMETFEDYYDAVYAHVRVFHSYATFVLQGIRVTKLSDDAHAWMQQALQK